MWQFALISVLLLMTSVICTGCYKNSSTTKQSVQNEQSQSEANTLSDVQPLLDNYDNLIKEACTITINCNKDSQDMQKLSFEENMEECISFHKEQSQDDQSGSCQDYNKVMHIVQIKCMIDVYKAVGDTFCDNSSKAYLDALVSINTCAETAYDLSKYEKCRSEHRDEFAAEEEEQTF